MYNLTLGEASGKDGRDYAKREPINLNLLTFYLIVLLVPFQYILDILGGPSHSASPAEVLEEAFLAAVFTYLGKGQTYKILGLSVRFLAIMWFTLCAMFILFYTATKEGFSSLSSASTKELLLLLAGAVLIRALWRGSDRYRKVLAFLGGALFPWLFMMTSVDLMVEAIHHLPYVYDPVLYRIDAILALGGGSVFADILKQHAILGRVVTFSYYYIALWGLLGAISQCLNTPPSRAYLLLCSFTLGILGFILYYLVPAVDPYSFFGALFPDHLPPSQTLPLHQVLSPIASFRNAMPSLHTGSALLIYLALRNSPVWHRVIGVYMVLCVVISTLALGEHYAVDLIAAFPLVLLVRGLCAIYLPIRQPARCKAVLVGGILTGLWVLVIRCAPVSLEFLDFIRVLAVLSVAVPVLLERELAKVESLSAPQRGQADTEAVVAETALRQAGV